MVAMMDDELGRLSDALKKAGVEDDTIFVYTSDHGEMFGAQGRMYKLTFYEESSHVPFYVRWPGKIKKDSSTDVCLNTPDIAPTLLGMAGVPVPDQMEGIDLSPAALGKKGPGPDCALLQGVGHTYLWKNGAEWRAVRDKRYTYARYLVDGKEHLYDNKKDPYQKNNLVDESNAKALLKRMRKALSDKMKAINDDFLPFADYREKFMAKDDQYSIVAGAKGPFKGPYAPIPSTRSKRKKK
jgi:arylsulfatase A-like enzyme